MCGDFFLRGKYRIAAPPNIRKRRSNGQSGTPVSTIFRLFACHTIQVGEGTFRLAEITPPAQYPQIPFERAIHESPLRVCGGWVFLAPFFLGKSFRGGGAGEEPFSKGFFPAKFSLAKFFGGGGAGEDTFFQERVFPRKKVSSPNQSSPKEIIRPIDSSPDPPVCNTATSGGLPASSPTGMPWRSGSHHSK